MPPHDNHNHSLREMDTLLQEMSHLNAGHAPDGMPAGLGMFAGIKDSIMGDKEWDAITKADAVQGEQTHKAILFNTLCELATKVNGWPPVAVTALKSSLKDNKYAGPILKTHMSDIQMKYTIPTATA